MIYESDAAAVPRQRSDAQGPEAGELPVREQVGGLASQGYRLWPLRVLQAWYECLPHCKLVVHGAIHVS